MPLLKPTIVAHWGQRAPRCATPNPIGPSCTLFVHFSATDGEGIDKKGEPRQAMHAIQNFHMDDPERLWCDIGYSGVLFQQRGIFHRPLLFKGRGFDVVPASQEGHNTGNISICVLADSNDRVKRSTYRALAWIVRHSPATRVKGHRDVNSTDCPGDYLYSKVPHLDRAARKAKLGAIGW